MADLYANALRRKEEGKYDDAVARACRALEYVAQFCLFEKHQIDSGDEDVSLLKGKVDADLTARYVEKSKRDQSGGGRVKLGLYECYELLARAGEEMGIRFMTEYADNRSAPAKYYNTRNDSILAHGFAPVGRDAAERFVDVVRSFMDSSRPGWSDLLLQFEFPKLPGKLGL